MKTQISSHDVFPQARAHLRKAGACMLSRKQGVRVALNEVVLLRSYAAFFIIFFFLSVQICNIFFFLEMQL